MRTNAFDRVATYWKNKAPDDFRTAHNDRALAWLG
jgi:hypothetical protein